MGPETDGLPALNLQPDVLNDVDVEEISGDQEKEAEEDPSLNSNADEPSLIVPHVPSSPKLKDPSRFAIPCPIGSHSVGKALGDMRASINLKPWWDEKGMIDEDPVVFEKLQCYNSFSDTMEQTPSYLKVLRKILSNKSNLGECETMTLTEVKSAKVTLLLMDGGFLNFRRGIG